MKRRLKVTDAEREDHPTGTLVRLTLGYPGPTEKSFDWDIFLRTSLDYNDPATQADLKKLVNWLGRLPPPPPLFNLFKKPN